MLYTINIYIQFDRIGLIYLWNNREGVFRLESLVVQSFLGLFSSNRLGKYLFFPLQIVIHASCS